MNNIIFPERLKMANLPTPIQKINGLCDLFPDIELYIKRDDFTGIECSGNKIRKLEFVAARAIQQKAEKCNFSSSYIA